MIIGGFKFANLSDNLVYVRIGNGFIDRRGNKKQIKGWYKLQKIMKKNKMINLWHVLINMLNIIALTYCPKYIREFAYEKMFRTHKKIKNLEISSPKSNLCSHCKTGMDMIQLDASEPMCPYISHHNGENCSMYKSL